MRRLLLLASLLMLITCAGRDEPIAGGGGEPGTERATAMAALRRESQSPLATLWDGQRLLRVHGDFAVRERQEEAAARAFLRRHAKLFRLRADGADLHLRGVRQGRAGRYLTFDQHVPTGSGSLPVIGARVIALVARGADGLTLRSVNLAHRPHAETFVPLTRDVGAARAHEAAQAYLQDRLGPLALDPRLSRRVLRGLGGNPLRLVYRVRLTSAAPVGDFELLIDGRDGTVLQSVDRTRYVDGSGYVFDPNPIATTGDYTLTDNGDAASPALDAARFLVTLPNLDGSGFTRGTWADVSTKQANKRAVSATLTFLYDRSEDGFEQANIYFHIDRAQTYLQALGFTNVNALQQVAISDFPNTDDSYFTPSTHEINCGTGGVDDGEDADIVLHEYGHAIQEDQVTGYGYGEAGAMGEGFGDYFASSVARTLSQQIDDPYCLGDWDYSPLATTLPPCLRRLDSTKHYPEHYTGDIHDDGEMWAAALFDLDGSLGADVMMSLVIEAHFSQAPNEPIFGAAQSILDADQDLFGGVHQDALRRRFIQQGLSRILSPPSLLNDVVNVVSVNINNPRVNGSYANNEDDTQVFSLSGAGALRLHFATFETELHTSCLAGVCDNVYLTDGSGDLYQVLGGNQSDTLSVAIPGDTVQIRLVTDDSVQLFGYHVDYVEILDVIGGGGGSGGGVGGSGGAGGGVGGSGGAGGGVGGSGAATSGGSGPSNGDGAQGGQGTSDGLVGAAADSEAGSGCGCRLAESGSPRPHWLSLLSVAALAWLRRRESTATSSSSASRRPRRAACLAR